MMPPFDASFHNFRMTFFIPDLFVLQKMFMVSICYGSFELFYVHENILLCMHDKILSSNDKGKMKVITTLK